VANPKRAHARKQSEVDKVANRLLTKVTVAAIGAAAAWGIDFIVECLLRALEKSWDFTADPMLATAIRFIVCVVYLSFLLPHIVVEGWENVLNAYDAMRDRFEETRKKDQLRKVNKN
jgi:hypothetical protein